MTELENWLAAEAAMRELHAHFPPDGGLARPEQLAGLNGLEQMQLMLSGQIPNPPISHTLDFLLLEVAPGRAVFQGQPLPKHFNPMGGAHGGWYATVLDSALGCSVHTLMDVGEGYTTLELKVNLVRAVTPKITRVRAVGRVRHRGRQMATAEADLLDADGTLYAHASTTCLVFRRAT
jgi:uncharacterized protein (TIGR00369 family)